MRNWPGAQVEPPHCGFPLLPPEFSLGYYLNRHNPKHTHSCGDHEQLRVLSRGEAAAGSMAATPTPNPGDIYKPRSMPLVLEVPASAPVTGGLSAGAPAAGPTKPPSWPEEHPGPEPRAPRRNRPQVPRTEAPGRGPSSGGSGGDKPCDGPVPSARAGSGGADARPKPRLKPAPRSHLSPSPRVGRRRAQARRGRGRSREGRA